MSAAVAGFLALLGMAAVIAGVYLIRDELRQAVRDVLDERDEREKAIPSGEAAASKDPGDRGRRP